MRKIEDYKQQFEEYVSKDALNIQNKIKLKQRVNDNFLR